MTILRNLPLIGLLQLVALAPAWLSVSSLYASDESLGYRSKVTNPFSAARNQQSSKANPTLPPNPFRRTIAPVDAGPIQSESSIRTNAISASRKRFTPGIDDGTKTNTVTNPFTSKRVAADSAVQSQGASIDGVSQQTTLQVDSLSVNTTAEPQSAEKPRLNRFLAGLLPDRGQETVREEAPNPPSSAANSPPNLATNSRHHESAAPSTAGKFSAAPRAGSAYLEPPAAKSTIAPLNQHSEYLNRKPRALDFDDDQRMSMRSDRAPSHSQVGAHLDHAERTHITSLARPAEVMDEQVTSTSFPSTAADESTHPQSAAANSSPLDRRQIVFRPGVPTVDDRGRVVLRPDVRLSGGQQLPHSFPSHALPTLASAPVQKIGFTPANVVPATAPEPRNEHVLQTQAQRMNSRTRSVPKSQPRSQATQSVYQSNQTLARRQPMPPAEQYVPESMIGEELPPGDQWMSPEQGMPSDMPMGESWGAPEETPDDDAVCSDSIDDPWMPQIGGSAFSAGPVGRACNGVLDYLHGPPCYQGALGVERVMFAPFFIETTQPLQNCRVRFDNAWDQEFPDRAEYFWAKTPNGLGPQGTGPTALRGEPSVDFQDIRFSIERGTPKFSVATELPIRIIDPDLRLNTAGFGDMNVLTKTVLLDGRKWQLSQLFRTYFPTGSVHRGTGNGHFSLEPGVAYRYKYSDITYFHGDLKYWFPLGADPEYGGQFLNYGLGISHVAVDGDCFAVIPTFEVVAWTVLDGKQTPPYQPIPTNNSIQGQEIDNLTIVNLAPGVRFVWENGHDCGTRELGISAGLAVSENQWYESILRVDMRWSF